MGLALEQKGTKALETSSGTWYDMVGLPDIIVSHYSITVASGKLDCAIQTSEFWVLAVYSFLLSPYPRPLSFSLY